jgi:toxin ParE1/3/4
MKIKWLRKALRNLEQAYEYISKENPAAAHQTVQKIQSAVNQLSNYPLMGRPGRLEGTRELVTTTSYIVTYRVRGDAIEILRVLHTSRRWHDSF